MLFEERHIVLKDGTPALLRPARVSDAAALVDYLVTTAGETEFIMAYPDERAGMTVEQEERFLQGVTDSPNQVFIVCEVNGEIAGNCDIHFNPKRKVRHRGAVAIALYKKYWNRGIGTAMFGLMFDIARGWGLEQLELAAEGVRGLDSLTVDHATLPDVLFSGRMKALFLALRVAETDYMASLGG